MKIKVIDIIKKSGSELADKSGGEKISNQAKPKIKFYKKDQDNGKAEILTKENKKKEPEKEDLPDKKFSELETIYSVKNSGQNNIRVDDDYSEDDGRQSKKTFTKYLAIFFTAAILAAFGYMAVKILPRVEINIATKKAAWNYDNAVTANPKIAEIDIAGRQIPSAIFSQKNNLTNFWPATGKMQVERKASGIITIYNEFSSSPQVLAINTRFEAPGGKIFKLKDRITIPGAKIENGKIVASAIDAAVVADKAGEAYNIDPVSRFSIPGFKGTDKYDKFYGSSKNPMSGGFVGEASYPTDNDIKEAKADAENKIKAAIEGYLHTQIKSENFKIIEGTNQFNVIKEIVDKETDEKGNFPVHIEAEGFIQAFKEDHLVDLMAQLARQAIEADFELKDFSIDYKGIAESGANNKSVAMKINFNGNFWKPVDGEEFKNKILSKPETDLKSFIFSSPNIERADISLWPFWVDSVPDDPKRVKVLVE